MGLWELWVTRTGMGIPKVDMAVGTRGCTHSMAELSPESGDCAPVPRADPEFLTTPPPQPQQGSGKGQHGEQEQRSQHQAQDKEGTVPWWCPQGRGPLLVWDRERTQLIPHGSYLLGIVPRSQGMARAPTLTLQDSDIPGRRHLSHCGRWHLQTLGTWEGREQKLDAWERAGPRPCLKSHRGGCGTVADDPGSPGLVTGSGFVEGPVALCQRGLQAPTYVRHLPGERVCEGRPLEHIPASQRPAQHRGLRVIPDAVTHRAPSASEKHLHPAGTPIPASGEPPLLVLCGKSAEVRMCHAHPQLWNIPNAPEQTTPASSLWLQSCSGTAGHSQRSRSCPWHPTSSRRMGPCPRPKVALPGALTARPHRSWRHTTLASEMSQPSSHTVPHVPSCSSSTRPSQRLRPPTSRSGLGPAGCTGKGELVSPLNPKKWV